MTDTILMQIYTLLQAWQSTTDSVLVNGQAVIGAWRFDFWMLGVIVAFALGILAVGIWRRGRISR